MQARFDMSSSEMLIVKHEQDEVTDGCGGFSHCGIWLVVFDGNVVPQKSLPGSHFRRAFKDLSAFYL